MTPGEYLAMYRRRKGWSQTEMAARMKCSKAFIQRNESPDRERSSFRSITRIARFLGVSLDEVAAITVEAEDWYQHEYKKKYQDRADELRKAFELRGFTHRGRKVWRPHMFELHDKTVELLKTGMTHKNVAKVVGYSQSHVTRIAHEHGMRKKKKHYCDHA